MDSTDGPTEISVKKSKKKVKDQSGVLDEPMEVDKQVDILDGDDSAEPQSKKKKKKEKRKMGVEQEQELVLVNGNGENGMESEQNGTAKKKKKKKGQELVEDEPLTVSEVTKKKKKRTSKVE